VGGEIKTTPIVEVIRYRGYHNAPWGARSKQMLCIAQLVPTDTTMPRGGRDQNTITRTVCKISRIPQCPVGGEIKTSIRLGLIRHERYHNAPWGARSKLEEMDMNDLWADTTMPRGGRDQNPHRVRAAAGR